MHFVSFDFLGLDSGLNCYMESSRIQEKCAKKRFCKQHVYFTALLGEAKPYQESKPFKTVKRTNTHNPNMSIWNSNGRKIGDTSCKNRALLSVVLRNKVLTIQGGALSLPNSEQIGFTKTVARKCQKQGPGNEVASFILEYGKAGSI